MSKAAGRWLLNLTRLSRLAFESILFVTSTHGSRCMTYKSLFSSRSTVLRSPRQGKVCWQRQWNHSSGWIARKVQIQTTDQWRWEGRGRRGHAPWAALWRGGIWRGFGNSASGKLAFALQNGFGGFVSTLFIGIRKYYRTVLATLWHRTFL